MARITPEKIASARAQGYDDDEIIAHLIDAGDLNPQQLNSAIEAGYEPDEILRFVSTGSPYDVSGGGAQALGRGVVHGAVDYGIKPMAESLLPSIRTVTGGAANPLTYLATQQAEPLANALFAAGSRAVPGNYAELEDLPPEERPYAVGGEVLGAGGMVIGGLPIAGRALGVQAPQAARRAAGVRATEGFFPWLAAKTGDVLTDLRPDRLIQSTLADAAARPVSSSLAQGTGVASSALGGMVAERAAPGDEGARLLGEVAGGMLDPVGRTRFVLGAGKNIGQNLLSNFSRGAVNNRAAQVVQRAAQQAGEDPGAIAQALLAGGELNDLELALTAGQRSGNPVLIALENQLERQSPNFGIVRNERAKFAREALEREIARLETSGTPEELTRAARLREASMQTIMDNALGIAQDEASRRIAAIGARGAQGMQEASEAGTDVIRNAVRQLSATNNQLWDAVELSIGVSPSATRSSLQQIAGELPSNAPLPAELRRLQQALPPSSSAARGGGTIDPASYPASELYKHRIEILEDARSLRAAGRDRTASQLERVAQAIMDDLMQLPSEQSQALAEAQAFTKTFHNTVSRGFAGRIGRESSSVPPELALERAFGSGRNRGNVQFEQLMGAAELAGPEFVEGMLTAEENFLRSAASDLLDPRTGRVIPGKFARFLAQNEPTLEQFPELRTAFQDAGSAEDALREFQKFYDAGVLGSGPMRERALFARVIGEGDPARTVSDVLYGTRNSNPVSNYRQLVELAQEAGPEATQGLFSSTLEAAYRRGVRADGTLDWERFADALLAPSTRNQGAPAVLPMMEQFGIADRATAGRMRAILRQASNLQSSATDVERVGDVVGQTSLLDDFVNMAPRVIGARAGAAFSGGNAGVSLQAAQMGSARAQQIFSKIPATRTWQVLEDAAKDPELMSTLLTRPTSVNQRRALENRLEAYLISSGLIALENSEDQE